MSFKEIKDERLELQKYKAGYETFEILTLLNAIIPLILSYAIKDDNPIIFLAYMPFFTGLWMYEFKAQEAEEFDEEQEVLKANLQRRKWIIISKRALFVALFIFLTDLFLEEKSIWQSIRFSLMSGIGIGIFWYFRMKYVLKKAKEDEHVQL